MLNFYRTKIWVLVATSGMHSVAQRWGVYSFFYSRCCIGLNQWNPLHIQAVKEKQQDLRNVKKFIEQFRMDQLLALRFLWESILSLSKVTAVFEKFYGAVLLTRIEEKNIILYRFKIGLQNPGTIQQFKISTLLWYVHHDFNSFQIAI